MNNKMRLIIIPLCLCILMVASLACSSTDSSWMNTSGISNMEPMPNIVARY